MLQHSTHHSQKTAKDRHRLCCISQKHIIIQSVPVSVAAFLIVCIHTYQGCVWCSFPSPDLVLTFTHRLTSWPVLGWSPFPGRCPMLKSASAPVSPGCPLGYWVVGQTLNSEILPCHLSGATHVLPSSPQASASLHSVLAITGVNIQVFGDNCFACFCHNTFSVHLHRLSLGLILHNHFYCPHLCIPLKPGLWMEPSAFLHATFQASWCLKVKNHILLGTCLSLILSVLHLYT